MRYALTPTIHRPFIAFFVVGLWFFAAGGCDESTRQISETASPLPGESLVVIMTEGELDRVASALAAKLRASDIARNASPTVRVAPPEWFNDTSVAVDQPGPFLDAFTDMVNSRVGGNVQFLRRPLGSTAPATADLVSRVSLLSDARRSSRHARLRTELLRPADQRVVFSFDEPVAVVASAGEARPAREPRVAARTEPVARPRPTPPPPPLVIAPPPVARDDDALQLDAPAPPSPPATPTAEFRFARDSLRDRLRITQQSVRKLPDGRLELKLRIAVARGRQRVSTQFTFHDAAGRIVEETRPLLREVRSSRPVNVHLSSKLPADRCVVRFDRD